MKIRSGLVCGGLALTAGFAWSPGALAAGDAVTQPFSVECPSGMSHSPNHVFYVDPVNGKATGTGTEKDPFNSLQAIFAPANGNSPLLSTVPYWHRDVAAGKYDYNPNASAPIKPGDEILLKSGNYGSLSIGVYGQTIANSDFVTIAAAPGATPVLSSIFVQAGVNKLIFEGLTISALHSQAHNGVLFYVAGGSDLIFQHNTLFSQDDIKEWSQQDWVNKASMGVLVRTGASCTTIAGNMIRNVRGGFGIGGDNTIVRNNSLDYFADDALDYAANNLIIQHNQITNSVAMTDGVHVDCMQGQTASTGIAGKFRNILIDGNTCIRQTDPKLPFPGSPMQGIDAFDSDWYNITVTNNVVITYAWQGISFASVHGALIANNIVLDDGANPGVPNRAVAWLTAGGSTHEGAPSNDLIVRNNIADTISGVVSAAQNIVVDHNLADHQIALNINGVQQWDSPKSKPGPTGFGDHNYFVPNLGLLFVEFEPAAGTFDLHLLEVSGAQNPAIGTGNADQMPPIDIQGQVRSAASPDLGAYLPGR